VDLAKPFDLTTGPLLRVRVFQLGETRWRISCVKHHIVLHDPKEFLELRKVVRQVPLTKEVQAHAVDLILATHPTEKQASPLAMKYERCGASPRGPQALILAGKINALLDNRYHISRADIDKAAPRPSVIASSSTSKAKPKAPAPMR
jgi:hypothetical protein